MNKDTDNKKQSSKSLLTRHFEFASTQTNHWLKDIFTGLRISLGIALGLCFSGILAVAVTGTFNSFTSGAVIKSSEVNANFATLKTAVEGITSSQWTTSGANIGYTGGNVGIGTTSPASKLTINQSSGTNADGIRLVNGSVNSFMYSDSGGRLHLETTGNSNSLVIADTGLIGIGTNTPSSLLSINSTGAANSQVFVRGQGTSAATYTYFALDSTATTTFYVADNGAGYLKGAAWTYGSDKRMKENIQYISNGLEKISLLKPAKFDYISGAKNQIGFIAQDVQKVIPEAVSSIPTKKNQDMLGLKTEFIIPYLVNSVKELSTRYNSLSDLHDASASEKLSTDKRVLSLEKENTKLREEITTLRQSVETHGRASLRLDERLRAVENTHMVRK